MRPMHILSSKDIVQGLPPFLVTDERVKCGAFNLQRSILHIRRLYYQCMEGGSIRLFFDAVHSLSEQYKAEPNPINVFKDTVLHAVVDVIIDIQTEK